MHHLGHTLLATSLHQCMSSQHVGAGELKRVAKRVVHMALCRSMNNQSGILDRAAAYIKIGNIPYQQLRAIGEHVVGYVPDVTCTSHLVENDYLGVRISLASLVDD